MSTVEGPPHGSEIIIIRRGHGDHDDGHHGGVWKIAFADFMTAMMCFFLVMWLINAANEETKAAVASYFNPVKLTDRNSSKKSLSDQGAGPLNAGTVDEVGDKAPDTGEKDAAAVASEAAAESGAPKSQETTQQADKFSDENLFADPYAVLAEIAAETGNRQNTSERGEGGAQEAGPATGASGGETYRDPFAPDFWSKQIAQPEDSGENPRVGTEVERDAPHAGEVKLASAGGDAEAFPADPSVERFAAPSAALPDLPAIVETPVEKVAALTEAEKPVEEAAAEKQSATEPGEATKAAAASIKAELEKVLADDPALLGGVSVTATAGGVLISVTDQEKYGMFEIGSALPRRQMVLGMEKIGKVVSDHSGPISINGHTDARPYAGQKYDNWRLSTARAHAAYYMLVRGGLDEKRVTEVAGFADRKLKTPEDPMSDANRRIEILVGTGQ